MYIPLKKRLPSPIRNRSSGTTATISIRSSMERYSVSQWKHCSQNIYPAALFRNRSSGMTATISIQRSVDRFSKRRVTTAHRKLSKLRYIEIVAVIPLLLHAVRLGYSQCRKCQYRRVKKRKSQFVLLLHAEANAWQQQPEVCV